MAENIGYSSLTNEYFEKSLEEVPKAYSTRSKSSSNLM
jgi:hypothetical protein